MYASQISNILKSTNGFKGVFPCDKVPVLNKTPTYSIIVNTSSSETGGEHWSAFIKTKIDEIVFIDSLAKPLDEYSYCFQEIFKKLTKGLNVKQLKIRLQGQNSIVCGIYSIFFIIYITEGISINILERKFSTTLNENDRKICFWFKKYLPLNSEIKSGQICKCIKEWKK